MAAKLIPDSIGDEIVYDPETGDFFRRIGTTDNNHGYRTFSYKGTVFLAHRVAHFLMTGEQPIEVDHINRERSDNRWCNLRNVTSQQNKLNRTFKGGVYLGRNNYWQARIEIQGVVHNLYHGKDRFEAWCRRKSAENTLHRPILPDAWMSDRAEALGS